MVELTKSERSGHPLIADGRVAVVRTRAGGHGRSRGGSRELGGAVRNAAAMTGRQEMDAFSLRSTPPRRDRGV